MKHQPAPSPRLCNDATCVWQMPPFILDDQLAAPVIVPALARWTRVQRLRDLRPHEVIKDDRVPMLLRSLRQPTFVTIDVGFWNRRYCDRRYGVIFFPLRDVEQHRLPELLRRLVRLPEFRTRRARMGVVARVSAASIAYWRLGDDELHTLAWPAL